MAKKKGRKGLRKQASPTPDYIKPIKIDINDIGGDSEDEFLQQREQILLDNSQLHSNQNSDYSDLSDEEVLGLDIDDGMDEYDLDEDDDEDDDEDEQNFNDEALLRKLSKHLKPKFDDEDDEEEAEEDGEDGDGGWGKSYYNADYDSQDDEMAKEEEVEALRLQKKKISEMKDEDFLDDSFELQIKNNVTKATSKKIQSKFAPKNEPFEQEEDVEDDFSLITRPETSTNEEIMEMLTIAHPEILNLVQEFNEKSKEANLLAPLIEKGHLLDGDKNLHRGVEFLQLKYQVLILYITNISFYLSMLSEPQTSSNPFRSSMIKSHPCLSVIVSLQELLKSLEENVEGKAAIPNTKESTKKDDKKSQTKGKPVLMEFVDEILDSLEDGAFDEIEKVGDDDEEEDSIDEAPVEIVEKKRKKKKNATKDTSSATKVEESTTPSSSLVEKKKKKRKKKNATTTDVLKVSDNTLETSTIPTSSIFNQDLIESFLTTKKKEEVGNNDFGDKAEMDEVDLEDKKSHRKSIKFHVSKVTKSSAKKNSKVKVGGDEDIPYLDKFGRRLTTRTKEEEEKAINDSKLSLDVEGDLDDFTGFDDDLAELMGLDDSEDDEQPIAKATKSSSSLKRTKSEEKGDHEFNQDEIEALEYYESIKNAKKQKLDVKEKRKEDREKESLQDLLDLAEKEEEVDEEGVKRPANYQILNNRGLTPHRKKENRNPRVKRRNKYEKAIKKLGSFKRVVIDRKKGGAYGGEMTGIKTNLTRSTKF